MDSITARLSAATVASAAKARAKVDVSRKSSAASRLFPSRLVSLSSRIGIGSVPKFVKAEHINHESPEGRQQFYEQICYLLRDLEKRK